MIRYVHVVNLINGKDIKATIFVIIDHNLIWMVIPSETMLNKPYITANIKYAITVLIG